MVLETLNISGFGCLRTTVFFSPDKLNLVVADNETGKSTLISAILAAFYGIVEDERVTRDPRPKMKNVVPWTNPEQFGLTLDFKTKDRRWRIVRDFQEGTVSLIDRDRGEDLTENYHKGRGEYNFGEELIGLSCPNFLKSFYLRQEEVQAIRDAGGLTPHVQQVATAHEGGTTSDNSISLLENALRNVNFPGSKNGLTVENVLKRNYSEKESILDQVKHLDRSRSEIEPQCERIIVIADLLKKTQQKRSEAERNSLLVEVADLTDQLRNQQVINEEIKELILFSKELKFTKDFPLADANKLINLSGRVEEISAAISSKRKKLETNIISPLNQIEVKLREKSNFADMSEEDLREFETAVSLYADRSTKLEAAVKEVEISRDELASKGVNNARFNELRSVFSNLTAEERQFIENFGASYATEDGKFREAKSRIEWIENEQSHAVEQRQKVVARARLFYIFSAVMLVAGGALILLAKGGWLGQVLGGLGAVFMALGLFTRYSSGGYDESRLSLLEEELEGAEAREREAHEHLDSLGQELTDLADKLGFSDTNKFLSVYANFDRIYELTEPLGHAERDLERARQEEEEAFSRLQTYFDKAGDNLPEEQSTLEKARALLDIYHFVFKLGQKFEEGVARRDDYEQELQKLDDDLKLNTAACMDILNRGEIDTSVSLIDAVRQFMEKVKQYQIYDIVINEKLPNLKHNLLSDENIKSKTDRLNHLKGRLGECEGEAETDPEIADRSKEYFQDIIDSNSHEIRQLQEEKTTIQQQISRVMDEYQNQMPALLSRLSELEDDIKSAENFRDEILISLSIMREISGDVYRSWAKALSDDTIPFLKSLNARYANLKFAEDLSFTILDRKNNRTISSDIIEQVLSTGARDEIFLAARLGISTYLSRGSNGKIPIVLDEPLAAADDDKFISGMSYFIEELSLQQQMLILSCHEQRHRWLAKQVPGMLRGRVQKIDLKQQH